MIRTTPNKSAFLPFLVTVLVFATILLLSSTPALSQSAAASGRLEGIVTDPSGATVPDADVAVRNQNTGVTTTVRSNATGEFILLYLAPGSYEVSIQKSGFDKLVMKDVTVAVGTRATLHPQLAVGKIDVTVTVSTEAPWSIRRSRRWARSLTSKALSPCRSTDAISPISLF